MNFDWDKSLVGSLKGGREGSKEIYGVIGASFDTESERNTAIGFLRTKGVPREVITKKGNEILVRVSTEEKFDQLNRWLREKGGSTWREE